MTIELNQKELTMLDDALVSWSREPSREAMGSGMMAAMLKGLSRREGIETDAEDEPKAIMAKAEAESKHRERQALMLRAKLAQGSAVQSEHEIA